MKKFLRYCGYGMLALTPEIISAQSFTLDQILALLKDHNPQLQKADARQAEMRAALQTARAYPNPELEIGGGTSTGKGQGALNGSNQILYLAQPLDLPFVRAARRQVADAGIVSADEANRAVWLIIRAKTQQLFYEILRRQAALSISENNERLLSQIRDKVVLKAEIGEAAQYEAVKAEAELLNAVKLRTSASVQVDDAKSALRALFVNVLPPAFDTQGELPPAPSKLPDLDTLRKHVLDNQPLLHQARAEVQKARAHVNLQQQLRYPQPILKAGVERDPGLEQWRVGITVPLPLWNQRQGPIAEAHAGLRQSEADAEQQEISVLRELENAYNRYLIADRQVQTFESGLLDQAKKALQVAEAGYRLGERGILDFLDAQRTYRSVHNDYLNAQFDRQDALIDLQRLNAEDLLG